MTNKQLYAIWGILYIVCAALGFIPEPGEFLKAIMVMISVAFFVPGGVILHRAAQKKDIPQVKRIRNLAILSLVLTLVLIVVNILSMGLSTTAGDVLYWLLIIVSAPMVCSQYWVVSLFLWACLMFWAISQQKNK